MCAGWGWGVGHVEGRDTEGQSQEIRRVADGTRNTKEDVWGQGVLTESELWGLHHMLVPRSVASGGRRGCRSGGRPRNETGIWPWCAPEYTSFLRSEDCSFQTLRPNPSLGGSESGAQWDPSLPSGSAWGEEALSTPWQPAASTCPPVKMKFGHIMTLGLPQRRLSSPFVLVA